MIRRTILVLSLIALGFGLVSSAFAAEWRAGVARVNITPAKLMWMSGYVARTTPAQGKLHDLWAKALVLEDAGGRRAVLVTLDLVGVDRGLSLVVRQRIEEQYQLPREAIVLASSHTHTGPVVGDNLLPMFDLDEEQKALVDQYSKELADKLVALVGAAIDDLAPAALARGLGRATFAVNRRNNPEAEVPQRRAENRLVGPDDHDVPVLAVHGADGALRAVVAGYACHATVLNDDRWSGDWPGAGQAEIERRHPGAVALYWCGCGADQNPIPRRLVELVDEYGGQFADAVDQALAAEMAPVESKLETAYQEIDLPFGEMPAEAELTALAGGADVAARRAQGLLEIMHREGELPKTYPYPVQLWRLGDDLNWFFLGGEVVVDYALRIKAQHGADATWVASYSNDVMGYIPSRRVLLEGGYEGRDSILYYGLAAPWHETAEQKILDAAAELAD